MAARFFVETAELPVVNEGTACQASEEERSDARAADMRFVPPSNEARSGHSNMIKPLSHWRSVGEVSAEARRDLMARLEQALSRLRGDTFAGPMRVDAVAAAESPSRAPFPARALRDRPWDVSALVE